MSMTENECNLLKYYERTVKECMEECDGICIMYSEGNCECVDANVLDHLRELQQYRAIGTVEEIQSMKDQLLMVKDMCKDYYAIGTIDEFKALKEKTIAEKPLIVPIDDTCLHQEYRCPSCNEWLADILKPYRCKCGKLLDWQ